jgi:hypothetical protein
MGHDLQRHVGAQRRPRHDGLRKIEVVHERNHLPGEEFHRVIAGVIGHIALAVAQ